MALTYPLPLAFFADLLPYGEIQGPFLRNFEERSGSADSRVWAAQMATPLWEATASLPAVATAAEARRIEATVHALDGMQRLFLFSPPSYLGPASGVATGLGAVTVSGIRADRGAIALAGLPAGFILTPGDFVSISYASGRLFFGQFSEGGIASGGGAIGQREIRPYLPMGISTGATIEMAKPRFRAMIEAFTPFTIRSGGGAQPYGKSFAGYGASITILQKP